MKIRIFISSFIYLISLFPFFYATAGEIDPNKEYRVALVIGNSNYKNAPLKNPVNDATAIANLLQDLDFEVVLGTDLNREQVEEKMREFSPMIAKADVAFFYFAGHGVQYQGENFLVPVSFDITNEAEISRESLSTSEILKKMDLAGNAVNIVILDACRNNPFTSASSSANRSLNVTENTDTSRGMKRTSKTAKNKVGLSRINGPSGSFIAYATAPGAVAADGNGSNGLYTLHLLEYMIQSGLSVEEVFKKVRVNVIKDSKGRQVPWENSSLLGDFYFIESSNSVGQVSETLIVEKVNEEKGADKFEQQFWSSVEQSQTPLLYHAYIRKFPQGHFIELAQIKLALLEQKENKSNIKVPTQKYVQKAVPKPIQKPIQKPAQTSVQPPVIAMNNKLNVFKLEPSTATISNTNSRSSSRMLFTGNSFVKIPAGCFTMGSPFGEEARQNDELDHKVCIEKNFEMGKYEVTQSQWKKVMGKNPAYFKGCGADCPVEKVSWNDVQAFIFRLNLTSDHKYRLPTEAEWEYAARSNTSTSTYIGNIELEAPNSAPILNKISWYSGNSEVKYKGGKYCEDWDQKQFSSVRCGTQKVGRKQPNSWGLYDMIGNVWEFTSDWYGSYSSRDQNDPMGARSGHLKVAKGGNWSDSLQQNRAAARYGFTVKERSNNLGFRLVKE